MGKVIAFKELTSYKGDYQPELRADGISMRRGAEEVPWGQGRESYRPLLEGNQSLNEGDDL